MTIIRVGVDIAKSVFHVHGADRQGKTCWQGATPNSLEHLLRMKVDIIKIDGSLIKSIATDTDALQITQGIGEFAHRLGIAVVAEYVHNAEVQVLIEKLSIDFTQGAYFGIPEAELRST